MGGDLMLIVMHSNSQTKGMVCGDCNHAFSNHKIIVNTKTSTLTAKCRICGCKGISEG